MMANNIKLKMMVNTTAIPTSVWNQDGGEGSSCLYGLTEFTGKVSKDLDSRGYAGVPSSARRRTFKMSFCVKNDFSF